MNKKWISPKTITGEPATNEHYFRRNYIDNKFWREVQKGNHILFVAPRRVGKTSMMKDLAENCPEGIVCIYEDLEAIRSRDEFFQRLFELILHCVHRSKLKEARAFFDRCLKKYSIQEISASGIKIDSKQIDYAEEIRSLMPEFEKVGIHTVIFLDEFAEIIYKLGKSGHGQDAVDILHTLRAFRHNGNLKHFTVVYGGSIGLSFAVNTVGRPKLINDLHSIDLDALTEEETSQLVKQLTEGATMVLSQDVLEYIMRRIEYFLPYYIQLMIEAIDEIAFTDNNPVVTIEMVDNAFLAILKKKKNFEDWLKRLKDYHADHFLFINEILKHAAHKGCISVEAIYKMALEYGRTEDYMGFVWELIDDGYLVESEKHVYRFISPLLQQFWLQNYPSYVN